MGERQPNISTGQCFSTVLCFSFTESSEEESDDEIAEKDSDVSGVLWSTAFYSHYKGPFINTFLYYFRQDNWDEDEEEKDSEKDEGVDEDNEEDEDTDDKEENGEDRDGSSEKELNGDSDLDPENESEEEWRQAASHTVNPGSSCPVLPHPPREARPVPGDKRPSYASKFTEATPPSCPECPRL